MWEFRSDQREVGEGTPYRTYGVQRAERGPLIRFMIDALESSGCRIIHRPSPDRAPFRITFETREGERAGIVAYAFLANNKSIRNRPTDEHRFQIKYGGDLSGIHEVWQDPYGLYVTLLIGINPERGFFVAADPELHNPTRFSVSVEFKNAHVNKILDPKKQGWLAWERERRGGTPHPTKKRAEHAVDEKGTPLFEVLVGGTQEHFLDLIRFEHEVLGEAPGERHDVAERFFRPEFVAARPTLAGPSVVSKQRLHALSKEFELPVLKVLDLIAERRMLKMAVRGSVAEEHLLNALRDVPGVTNCHRLKADHGPDIGLTFRGRPITVECKNSSHKLTAADKLARIDLQRTRASKSDECSRYYWPTDFDLVAACIHAVTGKWEFKYAASSELDQLEIPCKGRLSNNVKLDKARWTTEAASVLERIVAPR